MAREEDRRRQARSGPLALPHWLVASVLTLAALAATLLLVRQDRVDQAFRYWIAATALVHVVVVFLAPHRLYWRRDIAVLANLPIRGDALFGLALRRSLRASLLASLPLLASAAAFADLSTEVAARCAVLLGVATMISGLMAPALALIAGGVVASEKAQAVLGSLGGEFQAPKTSWLGILPGVAGAGLVLLIIAATPWLEGRAAISSGPLLILLIGGPVLSVALLAYAVRLAPSVGKAATQEVAALDRQRLAHVEKVMPSPLESLIAKTLPAAARQLFRKDISLAHRRFPLPYVIGLLCLVTAWIIGFAAPDSSSSWGIAVLGAATVYGLIMRRRIVQEPIEQGRLLATLPLPTAAILLAKQRFIALWLGWYVIVGGAPLIIRSASPGAMALVVGGMAVMAVAAGRAMGTGLRR